MADVSDGHLQMELRATGHDPEPDTDQGTVLEGWAALTTLVGVVEAWSADTEALAGELSEVPGAPETRLGERVVPGIAVEKVHAIPDGAGHRSLRRPDLGVV
jgi:hypothetical protein